MKSFDLPEAKLITRPEALRRTAEHLARQPMVAVDTESNSLHVYQEQVCLIQFSTPKEDILVDPLALDDLSPLAPIFADPKIEKIFHAAEYDLICLKRDFGFSFDNLFDTMVAARILGWGEVGLGSMLWEEFGVQLNKRHQQADWGKRPLPGDLLSYAQLDTHYLIPLRQRMKAALKTTGRWMLAREDFNRLRAVNGRDPAEVEEICWRINGANDLTPRTAAVLLELCRYRDRVARRINKPLFRVLPDRTLLAVAQALPRDFEELRQVRGIGKWTLRRHGAGILKAVERGIRADPVYPPRSQRPDEQYLNRLEGLRSWRKAAGREMGVDSDIVLPRDLMFRIASRNPGTREELADILQEVPWRLERFGDRILEALAKL